MNTIIKYISILEGLESEIFGKTDYSPTEEELKKCKIDVENFISESNLDTNFLALVKALQKALLFKLIPNRPNYQLVNFLHIVNTTRDFGFDKFFKKRSRLLLPSIQIFEKYNLMLKPAIRKMHSLGSSTTTVKTTFQVQLNRYASEFSVLRKYPNFNKNGQFRNLPGLRKLLIRQLQSILDAYDISEAFIALKQHIASKKIDPLTNLIRSSGDTRDGTYKFLYFLLAEKLGTNNFPKIRQSEYNRAIDLIETLINTYDGKVHNNFGLMYWENPIRYLTSIIKRDRYYSYFQTSLPAMALLTYHLFKNRIPNLAQIITLFLATNTFQAHHPDRKINTEVMYAFVNGGNPEDESLVQDFPDVPRPETISKEDVENFFTLFSKINMNSEILMPHQREILIPISHLFRKDREDFHVNSSALTHNSLFEILFKNLDYPNLGTEFEDHARSILSQNFSKVYHGCFELDGKVFEIDAMIIHGDQMLNIETKTKHITNSARMGNMRQLIVDIAKSYLKAMTQALLFKGALAKNGSIELFAENTLAGIPMVVNVPNVKSLSQSAICLIPFGTDSLMSKIVSMNLFDMFNKYSFGIREDKETIKLQDEFRNAVEQYLPLFNNGNEADTYLGLRHGSHFLCYEEFFQIFYKAKSPEDALKRLSYRASVQMGNYKMAERINGYLSMSKTV